MNSGLLLNALMKPPDKKEPRQRLTGEARHDRRSDFNRTADSQPHPATAAAGVGRFCRTPLYGTPTVLRRRSTTRAPWVGGLLSRLKKTFAGTPGNVCISSTLRRLLTLFKNTPHKGEVFFKREDVSELSLRSRTSLPRRQRCGASENSLRLLLARREEA
jgi:hypothetical protein